MWKVLIVDDEPRVRRGLRKWIEDFDLGFKVVGEASNYSETEKLASIEEPDLFIMDINMPGINGLEIITKLKVKYPNAYTIIVSGYDNFEYTHKALKLQVYDYMLKPIPKTDFYDVLTSLRDELLKKEDVIIEIDENISGIVQRVREYIDLNYSNPELSLNGVSEIYNVNKNYLSKLMKEELGSSFTEYLTSLRLEKAKEILVDGNSYPNILDIANNVGFNTQHYFSRVFKKNEGMSPLEYRNKYNRRK